MKQIIFSAFLIFAFCFITFAQINENHLQNYILAVRFDEIIKFDEYEKIPSQDERARLDSLFTTIAKDENLRSLIIIRFNKNEVRKKKIRRMKEMAEYFSKRKIDEAKFTLAVLDDEKERTDLYVYPQDVNLENLLFGETANYKIIKAKELKQKINGLFP